MLRAARRALHRTPRLVLLVALGFGIATVRPTVVSLAHRHAGGTHAHVHAGTPPRAGGLHATARDAASAPGYRRAAASGLHGHLVQHAVTAAIPCAPALAASRGAGPAPAPAAARLAHRPARAPLARGPPAPTVAG